MVMPLPERLCYEAELNVSTAAIRYYETSSARVFPLLKYCLRVEAIPYLIGQANANLLCEQKIKCK